MSISIAMPRMNTDPELTTAQSKYLESLARAGAKVHWVSFLTRTPLCPKR